MDLNTTYEKILRPFRLKRMKHFLETFEISSQTTILDVGGTSYNWLLVNCPAKITLLNIQVPEEISDLPENISYVQGNGTNLEFEEQSFDIVSSNSVIEHLYNFENQQKFAREASRVGRQLWIQTPAREFFFEPHYLTPFFHYLPKNSQKKIVHNFTVRGLLTRSQKEYVGNMVDEINLLSLTDFRQLFPNCRIQIETFFRMPKAYIAIQKNKR